MSDSTLSTELPYAANLPPQPVWGLSIAWSLEEPERVGQTFLLRGSSAEIGRGPGEAGVMRSSPATVRGGEVRLQPPLRTRRISRLQLKLQDGAALKVDNVGKTPMLVDGKPVASARLREHQVLELENSLVLVVVRCSLVPLDVDRDFSFGSADPLGLVGESDVLWRLRRSLAELRELPGHVLIAGPSGAGKELCARGLRTRATWVARSAATIPDGLAAAELFGNRKDYPNAGMPDRPGLVGEADGGTLYLDEIGELPLPVQTSLLRVLDAGEYQRLGETRTRRAQLRLVGATNQPLDRLRHDLLARFRHRLALPGLDERVADIPLLVRHQLELARTHGASARFFDPHPRMAPRLVRSLLERRWTTHARELDGVLWAALRGSPHDHLDLVEPEQTPSPTGSTTTWRSWRGTPADALPPEVIQACLDEHNGAQEAAWQALQLSSRHVLRRLIQRHGLVVTRRG